MPATVVAARATRQLDAVRLAGGRDAPQILFGDLHVHTTFSADAFEGSLPILGGEGAHPPADACDFARYCADLDFWALTEHAEFLDPQRWRDLEQSVRTCQQRGADSSSASSSSPASSSLDMVSFLGWEWTQIGATPDNHYGHKNIILRSLDHDDVPPRPIAYDAPLDQRFTVVASAIGMGLELLKRPFLDSANRSEYWDHLRYTIEMVRVAVCPEGVPYNEQPDDCRETAASSDVLFRKLREWGGESMVIPHGNTWGLYTPPGTSWRKQLQPRLHDPEQQTLIEIYSGHGNAEEYRPWRAVEADESGAPSCPEPTDDYQPCCWRAGQLIRDRCVDPTSPVCQVDVVAARANYVAAGSSGHLTVPGAGPEDWLACGQCLDCFMPAFNHRPGGSVQAAMAMRSDNADGPERFRFGFIASSDNHTARPGTGYKEYARTRTTDTIGANDSAWSERLLGERGDSTTTSTRAPEEISISSPHAFYESERRTSYLATGGLVAAHATARTRDALWESLERREVYGTSGPRILLWFDLLNGSAGRQPMGSATTLAQAPRFEVRALGALVQKPGCPEHTRGLSAERLALLCAGECYNPGDRRHAIERIEVVRILPARGPDEVLADAIQDPWRVLACPADGQGCRVVFEDPELPGLGRDALYYVRAIQEPTDAINGAGLRCETDADGACIRTDPCYGSYKTSREDDCLAPIRERAWSSPIFVDRAQSR